MTSIDVAAIRVQIPFRTPFATSLGTWREHDAWIVRLRRDDGQEGYGEACLGPSASAVDRERLAESMRAAVAHPGDRQSAPTVTDPIELAVEAAFSGAHLDLEGVELGIDGRVASDIAVNATIASEDVQASIEAARQAAVAGFPCIKLKVGGETSTKQLVDRVTGVRETVGPGVALRLDANGAWDAPTALERATGVAGLDIEYLEQPIAAGSTEGLITLRRASPVPIAADESVDSMRSTFALLEAGAVDVLVIKPARVGGPGVARALAEAALDAGVGVTISTLFETGVGLATAVRVAAALPGDGDRAHGLATADLLVSDLLATPLLMTIGRITVPGAGIHLDEAALERWSVERIGAAA